jgi:hypothetical protein
MVLKNSVYEKLKYITMIVLPALTTLWLSVGSIWQLPLVEPIGATLTAVTAFLGAILGISTSLYNIREQRKDELVDMQKTFEKEETPDE